MSDEPVESGPMRTDHDVTFALGVLEGTIIGRGQQAVMCHPTLFVELPCIRAALYEVLERRRQDRAEGQDHAVEEAVKAEDRLSMDDDATGTKNADPITSGGLGLRDQLTKMLNQRSREGISQTPDYLLAEFLIQSLIVYESTVRQRDNFHGVKL